MKTKAVSQIARISLGVTGGILVLLGIAFWTGHALTLIPAHEAIGVLFVISLWVLSFLGLKMGLSRSLIAFAFLWGLIVLAVGATQAMWLPGGWHWVIQVVHLLIGIVAMIFGALLHKRISPLAC
jgi:hypothetical protein